MKHTKIRYSFSARLTLYICMVVALVFVLALTVYYKTSCKQVEEEAMANAEQVLSKTENVVSATLGEAEMIAENMAWLIPHFTSHVDSLAHLTRQVLRSNTNIYGCAVAFEPGFFKRHPLLAPYSYRKGDAIVTKDLGEPQYNYVEKDWFRKASGLKSAVWSDPYYDERGGERLMVTYSKPLLDPEGHFYAVLTMDLLLSELEEVVHNINPFPDSYSMMVGDKGEYIVRPNDMFLEKENIFASAENRKRGDLKHLGEKMLKGEKGSMVIDGEEDTYLIFFAPVCNRQWSVAVASRERDVFESIVRMTHNFLMEALAGLLLLVVVCYFVIRHMTHPLKQLTASAVEIAQGNFSARMPRVRGKDEMAALCDSFDLMQRSLVEYIEELKRTTIERERIESDLRIAGEIQMNMVPQHFPVLPNHPHMEVYGHLQPAKEVGGDLYQYVVKNDQLYFIIGDVSGKGVPAALEMSALCRLFRLIALQLPAPVDIVKMMNNAMADGNDTNMFCTAFVGVLHLSSGKLDYCNAGHNPVVLLPKAGNVHFLPVIPNLPLGLFENFNYRGQSLQMAPGDALLLYTDGVTEAENRAHDMFSDSRLLDLLRPLGALPAQQMVERVFEAVSAHAAGAAQSDDITVMGVRY